MHNKVPNNFSIEDYSSTGINNAIEKKGVTPKEKLTAKIRHPEIAESHEGPEIHEILHCSQSDKGTSWWEEDYNYTEVRTGVKVKNWPS